MDFIIDRLNALEGRGKFRYVLFVKGSFFFSAPMDRTEFLGKWEEMIDLADLVRVEYESKTEYTPGNYIWQTF